MGRSIPNGKPAGTRDRILAAASALFAERGYRGTTVAMICRQARRNIAAVNYHFGSKENLYRESWRQAFERVRKRFPADGGVPAGAAPQERLRGWIRAALQRALSDDDVGVRIMHKEIANPTGLLRQVVEDAIGPLRQAVRGILGELLGAAAGEQMLRLCEVSVIGPVMHIMRKRHKASGGGAAPRFGPEMLDGMVEHFTAFALAGIEDARRRQAAAGRTGGTSEGSGA